MPDVSGQRHCVEDLERIARLMASSGRLKGGIFETPNGKSYTVNIRPSKWNDKCRPSTFWIGKKMFQMGVLSYGWAQYCADTIYHYTGRARFHFKDADLKFPVLECMGTEINTTVCLTTTAIRLTYVQSIAGERFAPHRKDFIEKVTKVMESSDFIRQGERLLNPKEEVAALREEATVPGDEAASAGEEAAVPGEEAARLEEEVARPGEEAARLEEEVARSGEEDVVPAEVVRNVEDDDRAEDAPPMELDNMSLQAIRLIQLSSAPLSSDVSERVYPTPVLHVAGSDTDLVRGLDFSQAYAPSFEFDLGDSGNSLRSVGQSLGSTCFTLDDCPSTHCKDKEKHCSWMDGIAELNTSDYCSRMEVHNSDELELDIDFDNPDYRSWMEDLGSDEPQPDTDFDSTTTHMTAEAKQPKNAKRQRIGDCSKGWRYLS